MATFKPVVLGTKKQIKRDGTANIKIRIYHNKSTQYISTPFYVCPKDMGANGEVASTLHDADILNYLNNKEIRI